MVGGDEGRRRLELGMTLEFATAAQQGKPHSHLTLTPEPLVWTTTPARTNRRVQTCPPASHQVVIVNISVLNLHQHISTQSSCPCLTKPETPTIYPKTINTKTQKKRKKNTSNRSRHHIRLRLEPPPQHHSHPHILHVFIPESQPSRKTKPLNMAIPFRTRDA
jgi:hypothetical protein